MKVMIKKGISSDYAKPLKALYDERRLLMETEVYKSKPLMLRKGPCLLFKLGYVIKNRIHS